MSSAAIERAANRIAQLYQRRPDVVELATLASLAVRVESHLLRRLRLALLPDADVGTEADLWFSPLAESCGVSAIVLHRPVVELLRTKLAESPLRLRRAIELTAQAHAQAPATLRLEEQLTALVLLNPPDLPQAIDQAIQPALKTLHEGGDAARQVAQWALRALPQAHPMVQASPNARTLGLGSTLILGGRPILLEATGAPADYGDIGWLMRGAAALPRARIGVGLTGDGVVFTPPGGPLPQMELPATQPLLLTLSWDTPDGEVRKTVDATPGRSHALGAGVSEVLLQTVGGDAYRLSTEAVRQLVETRRIFVSCTTRDLQQYRDVAEEVINAFSTSTGGNRISLRLLSMDTKKTPDGERATSLEVSQTWIYDCDWVVLIVAWNYGYVPDGETRSVTESEYRAAIAENKKVFIFIPGERSDNERAYRASDRERVDLKDWIDNNPRRPELEAFKAELRKSRLDVFRNLDDFRERLTEALRQAVTQEVFQGIKPTIDPLELLPPLRDALDELIQVARLKRLHDALHQIRHFGIRTWREELLASWPDDGDPPLEAQIKYLKGAPGIAKLVERLRVISADLPDGVKRGLPKLSRIVTFSPPEVPDCGKVEFEDATEAFARRMQSVFTDCDAQMRKSAVRLEGLFRRLAAETNQVLASTKIAEQQATLARDGLERSFQVHARLQQILLNHTQWQRVHDDLEEIDLKMVAAADADNGSIEGRKRAFLRALEDFIDAGGAPVDELLAAVPAIMMSAPGERAAKCETLARQLKEQLDNLIREPDVDQFDLMRRHFDNLFFQVDLETLAAIENVEAGLRGVEVSLKADDRSDGG